MVAPADRDFFTGAASAAGALVGLLFVALSIWQERDDARERVEAHRLRATAALAVFTNALVVSLAALVPGNNVGEAATVVAVIGIGSVVGSALRLVRLRRQDIFIRPRDVVFVMVGAALFATQMVTGVMLWLHPGRGGASDDIADLLIGCFAFGIARSWELIGGPHVGVAHEMRELLRSPQTEEDAGE